MAAVPAGPNSIGEASPARSPTAVASTVDDGARLAMLAALPEFEAFPEATLHAIVDDVVEVHYARGDVIFAEKEPGDRLFVVVDGAAELTRQGRTGPVPVATVGPGDLVGTVSLLSSDDGRTATLTAMTPVVALTLDRDRLRALLDEHPEAKAAFERQVDHLRVADFIRHVGPFNGLDAESCRWLATRLRQRTVAAGEVLIRQGDAGDSCYLIRSGAFDLTVADDAGRVRTLRPLRGGTIVGETALLTDAPRSATVRALDDAEVYELRRADLEAVVDRAPSVGHEMIQLFRLRDRPRRAPGVIVNERTTADGETVTVLKHPVHLTYFRLSERGRAIWDLLDGERDTRLLTLELLERFGEFRPDVVIRVLTGLANTKMIEVTRMTRPLADVAAAPTRRARVLDGIRRLAVKQVSLRDIDAWVTTAYRRGVRLLFTPPAQLCFALVAVVGLVAFFAVAPVASAALADSHPAVLLAVLPGLVVSTLLHEAGHAFTVKALGREVNRAGVGWYWFGPVAFCDTSDMWLGTRRERVLVSLAGPYTDVIVAGALSLVALAVGDGPVTAVLWMSAVPSYYAVLLNFNPLLEYDGYHILSDVLDRPNLRAEALGWVGSRLPAALRDPTELRRHVVDLLYGAAAVAYIGVMGVVVIATYRATLMDWLASVVPYGVAAGLAWLLAGLVTASAALMLAGELRAGRRSALQS